MSSLKPIGIFDSGIGGLSVFSHIRKLLPAENIIYVLDTKYLPYGSKEPEIIKTRSLHITQFLLKHGVKSVVVACNTATAVSISTLREHYEIPIIGMEPGVKPGIENSRNGKVAILATTGTLESTKFKNLIRRYNNHATIIIQPCHGWVELVENQHPDDFDRDSILRAPLIPLLEHNVDTIVLGCTHYPFLRNEIEQLTEGGLQIIDTGEAVARQLKRRMVALDLLNTDQHAGTDQFWSSSRNPKTERIISHLLHKPCKILQLPE